MKTSLIELKNYHISLIWWFFFTQYKISVIWWLFHDNLTAREWEREEKVITNSAPYFPEHSCLTSLLEIDLAESAECTLLPMHSCRDSILFVWLRLTSVWIVKIKDFFVNGSIGIGKIIHFWNEIRLAKFRLLLLSSGSMVRKWLFPIISLTRN